LYNLFKGNSLKTRRGWQPVKTQLNWSSWRFLCFWLKAWKFCLHFNWTLNSLTLAAVSEKLCKRFKSTTREILNGNGIMAREDNRKRVWPRGKYMW